MNNLVLQILFDTINRSGSGVISKNELRLFYTAFLDVGKLGEKKIRKISDLLCYFVLFYFFLLQLITGSKKKIQKILSLSLYEITNSKNLPSLSCLPLWFVPSQNNNAIFISNLVVKGTVKEKLKGVGDKTW